MRKRFWSITLATFLVGSLHAGAALAAPQGPGTGPIPIYVEPYYESATTPGAAPVVHVGKQFDTLLSSGVLGDILAVRDAIAQAPDFVTPMTLFVLAIRLWDLGEREEGVFWYYAGQTRFRLLTTVIDMDQSGLSEVQSACDAFKELAGPTFNGFAFGDIDWQNKTYREAVAWATSHPYQAISLEQLQSREPDREKALAAAIEHVLQGVEASEQYFKNPKRRQEFIARRHATGVDARYPLPRWKK